jgi:hypothetical protein
MQLDSLAKLNWQAGERQVFSRDYTNPKSGWTFGVQEKKLGCFVFRGFEYAQPAAAHEVRN